MSAMTKIHLGGLVNVQLLLSCQPSTLTFRVEGAQLIFNFVPCKPLGGFANPLALQTFGVFKIAFSKFY